VTIAAILFAQLFLLGANAVLPWRLATGEDAARRLWSLVCLPLLLLSLVLALAHLSLAPDGALFWGLSWPPRTTAARIVLVIVGAGAGGALLTAIGGRKFEPAAWRTAAILGGLVAAGAAFGGELLRFGGGPTGGLVTLLAATAGRFAVTLAAGECVAGPPRWLTPIAALLLPLGYLASPPELRAGFGADILTLAAAVLLLLVARFVPADWRRAVAIAGIALAALHFARAAEISATFEQRQFTPESVDPRP
jgi:hypothetical protein